LIATGDPEVSLVEDKVLATSGEGVEQGEVLAAGTGTTAAGAAYIFRRMGLRQATAAEVARAYSGSELVRVYDRSALRRDPFDDPSIPKLRVGPDERPARVNSYGFDVGAGGYWVVPVASNTSEAN
jgi:hypothetical protein